MSVGWSEGWRQLFFLAAAEIHHLFRLAFVHQLTALPACCPPPPCSGIEGDHFGHIRSDDEAASRYRKLLKRRFK